MKDKDIHLHLSGLHANALATHLLIVLNQYVTGRPAGSIPEDRMALLTHLDQACRKLMALTGAEDDESPQALSFTLPEAEAFIKAFTEEELKEAALGDAYYQRHAYAGLFAQIYSPHLEAVSAGYVEAWGDGVVDS